MNKRIATLTLLMTLGGAAFVHDAAAAQLGFYGGAYYAQNQKQNVTLAPFDDLANFVYDAYGFTPITVNSTVDDKDASYGFNVGYRWLRNFAIEAAYMDLGTVAYRNRSNGLDQSNGQSAAWLQNIESTTSGIAATALGILPIGERFEVYARGGVMITNNALRVYISDGPNSDQLRVTGSGTSLMAGAGLSLNLADIYQVRLEFQRVFDAGDDDVAGKDDVDMLSLGFTASF